MSDIDPLEHGNGLRAFDTLGRFLEEDGWFPQRLGENYSYLSHFNGKNGSFACLSQLRIEAEQLIIYAVAPIKVAEDKRAIVSEYLMRANYGMIIGNFEMSYSEGTVRYKVSIDFEGELLTDNLIRNAIYPTCQLMDRYLGGLMQVAYGQRTPEDMIKEIEG